jgi:hypothetical protein
MWILECSGDFLQGKRMWLKPGQHYLFGRVKREGVQFAIDHKTVSRKHFVIEVDAVKEGDEGRIHARTKLKIQDFKSKSGTQVNGELIRDTSRELKEAENSVRPGSCPQEIVIKWQPCVLTFNLLKKDIKSGVLKTKQARVQGLDIKAIGDFSSEHTTHVVANKRNTAKGLLALVTGKHLVAESYIDALEYKATPTNLSQEENLSSLEIDFDSAWPDPKDYLPPPGKEPTISAPAAYKPDPSRSTVFEGYTFVFGEQTQYDNLMPMITSGHGKALLFKPTDGEMTSDDLIKFLGNVSGHKDGGARPNGSNGKVILVRWRGKDDVEAWTDALINETALKMDQRAIDQSEFLGAILAKDAGLLQQAVPFESTNDGRIAPPPSLADSLSAKQSGEAHTNNDSESATVETAQLRTQPDSKPVLSQKAAQDASQLSNGKQDVPRPFQGPRFTQAGGFKNFDDGFDPEEIAAYEDDEEEEVRLPKIEATSKTQTQSSKIKDEPRSSPRKRHRSLSEDPAEAFADEMDDLLPAATAFKRQKLAQGQANGRGGTTQDTATRQPAKKKTKKERELDVREVVKAQRQQRDEAARREQEDLAAGLGDLDEKAPTNLVTIVTMQLPLRDHSRDKTGATSDRGGDWDPKWNGRKNFKGFRPKGETLQRRGPTRKVIVPLVEVKGNTYGFGDQYWEKTEEEKERASEKKKKEHIRSQRTPSQTQQRSSGTVGRRSGETIVSDSEDEENDDHGIDAADGIQDYDDDDDVTSTSPAISRLQREAADIVDHEIDPDVPRRTRATDRSQTANVGTSETPRSTVKSKATTTGKRAATSNANGRESKRQKTLPVTVVHGSNSEDDDSDDMKFRFGSRARKRGGSGVRGKG